MTAGGATTTAHEKQAAATQGGEAGPALPSPHASLSTVPHSEAICCLPKPAVAVAGEGARVVGRGIHREASPRLTFTQVHASFEVPLLLVYNFSHSPGEKKFSEHLVFTQNLRGS